MCRSPTRPGAQPGAAAPPGSRENGRPAAADTAASSGNGGTPGLVERRPRAGAGPSARSRRGRHLGSVEGRRTGRLRRPPAPASPARASTTSSSRTWRSRRLTSARTVWPGEAGTRRRNHHARTRSLDPSSTARCVYTLSSLVRTRLRSTRPSTTWRPVTRSASPASTIHVPRSAAPPTTAVITTATAVAASRVVVSRSAVRSPDARSSDRGGWPGAPAPGRAAVR